MTALPCGETRGQAGRRRGELPSKADRARQIGLVLFECLVTGFHHEQGELARCVPHQPVPLGARLL